MTDFLRVFPIPHLPRLGKGEPRDDNVLVTSGAQEIFAHEVLVAEKINGANVGFLVDERGTLRAQIRGIYISLEHSHAQFKPPWRERRC